jgi:membrane protease YdiL (CAAX protease family)
LGLLLLAFLCSAFLGNSELIPKFGKVDFSQINFDLQFKKMLSEKMDLSKIKMPSIPPLVFLVISILQGIIAGATLNLPFMFGEEFGWRGLLLSETKSMGFLKSNLFIGIVWGLWHLPIIMMGHNYPNHPHFGILMMCFMTTALAPVFAYVRVKSKTILGPCFLHGMINGTAALFAIYIANGNELYSGLAGWAGVIAAGLLTLGIFIFDKKFITEYSNFETEINSN